MHAVADTDQLVADGVITTDQAATIEARAREAMIFLAINALLCFGIIIATAGLVFWLANATAVAVCGSVAIGVGLLILNRGGDMFRMFGNASTLIGAGMLIGGASIELIDKYEGIAGWAMIVGGAIVLGAAGWALAFGGATARFVTGAILLMGVAMHLGGIGFLLDQHRISGLAISIFYLYGSAIVVGAGWLTNVRLVTALAIAPFAQALDTGTFYFHAAYVFYSPEPTLSILQMTLLIGVCAWISVNMDERTARHAQVLAAMAFIVANLCALVGSLWGDIVGETIWGPGRWYYNSGMTLEAWQAAHETFLQNSLTISEHFFTVIWALALVAVVLWAAHGNKRGLFNTALTFGGIHAYTQMFETFWEEPLAYVIGGLVAIPAAWGMWRLNHWFVERAKLKTTE